MVKLHSNVGGLAHEMVAHFLVDECEKAFAHIVGGHQQLLELDGAVGNLDELEHAFHVVGQVVAAVKMRRSV